MMHSLRKRIVTSLWLVIVWVGVGSTVVSAQIISPGELIEGHAPWDRIDSCISCHALGKKGVEAVRCLDCHTSVRDRLELDLGFHTTVEDVTNCASCHKDHFGRDFDAIRFDTTAFDHDLTGYELLQSHTDVACASCHVPEFRAEPGFLAFQNAHGVSGTSYLGLTDTCETCHDTDNVHGAQFADVTCSTCHDQAEWEEAPLFDHDTSRYPLTGLHTDVACADCHEPAADDLERLVYKPLAFAECSTCHDDVHNGSFGATCTTCHTTIGWGTIATSDFESTFNHDVTAFALVGAHEAVACATCHTSGVETPGIAMSFIRSTIGQTYPHPISTECASCHEDAHDASVPLEATCSSCHTEDAWVPSDFDVFRHADETDYPLEGAHLAVLCADCHATQPADDGYDILSFRVDDQTCEGCHTTDDPHDGQFAEATCASCHSTDDWMEVETSFDHATTDFPLLGAHALTACISCHVETDPAVPDVAKQFNDLASTCISCHTDDDPHDGQFEGETCATCHDEVSFLMAVFDHTTTAWPLEGAHVSVACASCHTTRPDGVVQYRGIGTACIDCHNDQ